MLYGYARVSSKEQNLDRQLKELRNAGIDDRHIVTDKQSGKDFNRRGYNLLTGTEDTAPLMREGDCLMVYSLDRLGRNYEEIREQWQRITKDMGCDICVLDMPILDTRKSGVDLDNTFIADLVLQILSYVAQKERESIRVRQAQGIACAKAAGKHLGRPAATYPDRWAEKYTAWKAGDITATQAMNDLGLKRNTFYKLAKQYEEGGRS